MTVLKDLIALIDDDTACVVVQTPDFFGNLHDYEALAKAAHEKKALLIVVVTEIVSLGALKSPGEMGADIVVAEGQSLGCGLDFGGPYVGLFATRQKIYPSDAGAFVRADGGWLWQARLCADIINARTTYPARKGDL